MIPNLYLLTLNGEVLIEKQWTSRFKRTICDMYWERTTKNDTFLSQSRAVGLSAPQARAEVAPVISYGKYVFISVFRSNLTFLVVTTTDSPPLFVLEFLHLLADTFNDYFGVDLNESGVRDHFATVYQLLDEMVDGGFTSTTELNTLKDLIAPPSIGQKLMESVLSSQFSVSDRMSAGAVSKIPWRRADVKHVTNEIYFDCVESIDAITSANGGVMVATVFGEMKCNCRLSGVPDLTLSFTKQNLLDDVSFHRCVRIQRYQRERVLSFVPPDGPFKLMSYRVGGITQMPIYVKPQITFRAGSARVHIMVGSKLGEDKPLTAVKVLIPFPTSMRSHTLTVNVGTIHIDTPSQLCHWEIGRIPKDVTPLMEGGLVLMSDQVVEDLPVLRAEFVCKMYAASGLKVDGLAIRNVGYKPFKGVRSVTQAGKFQIRAFD